MKVGAEQRIGIGEIARPGAEGAGTGAEELGRVERRVAVVEVRGAGMRRVEVRARPNQGVLEGAQHRVTYGHVEISRLGARPARRREDAPTAGRTVTEHSQMPDRRGGRRRLVIRDPYAPAAPVKAHIHVFHYSASSRHTDANGV